jgi:hypothetical protein
MAMHHRLIALACVAALGTTVPAAAQNAFTLYGGVRTSSGFRQADPPNQDIEMSNGAAGSVGIEWPADAGRMFQLFLSTQRTKLDLSEATTTPGAPTEMPLQVSYIHIGGLNFFEGGLRGPYIVGGLGATVLSPSLQGTSTQIRPSMNVGVGYQWPLGRAVSLRTELRGYVTLINSSGQFFCSGGCVVSIQGDTMTQVEALVGLTFGF